jgi:mannose-6-phosphate isomerase-like protein (cupin superfamily)
MGSRVVLFVGIVLFFFAPGLAAAEDDTDKERRARLRVLEARRNGDLVLVATVPGLPDTPALPVVNRTEVARTKADLTYEEYAARTRQAQVERHHTDLMGYVVSGELEIELPGHGAELERMGDAFYIPAGQPHISRNPGLRVTRLVVVHLRAGTPRSGAAKAKRWGDLLVRRCSTKAEVRSFTSPEPARCRSRGRNIPTTSTRSARRSHH